MANGRLIITVGLPRSGKTTWAKEMIAAGKADFRVNRDDLRYAFFGEYILDGSREKWITKLQHASVEQFLQKGKTVIVDDTNLRAATRRAWRELALRNLSTYEVNDEFLKITAAMCNQRDENELKQGGRYVGFNVIDGMANRYSTLVNAGCLVDEETFVPVFSTEGHLRNQFGKSAIIVDIDGTVADCEGIRSPYDSGQAGKDRLRVDTAYLVNMVQEAGVELIFVSGRSSEHRYITEQWLDNMGFDDYHLYMREAGDKRDDKIVKFEIYLHKIYPDYCVRGVFDDRDRVVSMWRTLGLQVYQVNYGAF